MLPVSQEYVGREPGPKKGEVFDLNSVLGYFDREFQADGLRDGRKCEKAGIAARRQSAIEAFPLDAGRSCDLGDAAAVLSDVPQYKE